ncbi:MAG TPA: ATP-binding protein [Myxococcota bacterium]|nr:ATP-binding protein [Myxococcota bacterium]
MSDARVAGEAFALTSDPGAYVPSPERERALAQMASALMAGSVPCLEGPTGIGKTLLLQLLAQRVSDRFDPLYLPYPMLSTPELCTLAIGLLGHELTPDPEATLLRIAAQRAARGRPLLLLIDDATSLPPDSARGLAALREQAAGSLQVALAGIGGPALLDASAPFGATLKRVTLEERIPRTELRDYVVAQLEHASAPASLRRAFDDDVLEELERAASGNPRRLHLAAQSILKRAEGGPAPEPVETRVAAAIEPPSSPEPAPAPTAPPRVAPPVLDEPVGEYRVVRRRTVESPPEPVREAPPARAVPPVRETRPAPPSPPPPPPQPEPERVDVISVSPPLPTPPWQEAAPAAPARARAKVVAEPAGERPPRRVPTVPIFLAVALVSAVLGFVLASRLQRDVPVARSAAPSTAEPAPTPPAATPTVPEPAVEEPVAETSPAPEVAPEAPPPGAEPEAVAVAPEPEAVPEPAPAPTAAPAPGAAPAPPPPPVMVEISINASPWALIEIDGKEVGETPLGGVAVERGPHDFVARFPDGRVVERSVAIDAEHRTLVFE